MSHYSALPKLPLPAPRTRLRLVHSTSDVHPLPSHGTGGIHIVLPGTRIPHITRRQRLMQRLQALLGLFPSL